MKKQKIDVVRLTKESSSFNVFIDMSEDLKLENGETAVSEIFYDCMHKEPLLASALFRAVDRIRKETERAFSNSGIKFNSKLS